jgi:hypothetical protein
VRRSTAPFPLFALVSVALHAGALAGAVRRPAQSVAAGATDATPAPLFGETLDVEQATQDDQEQQEEGQPSAADSPSQPTAPATPRAPLPSPGAGPRALAAPSTSASPSTASKPALFGAVGVRYASDLAKSFTGAFPQAASPDPIWSSVAFGAAGTADVTLVLDDGGRLASHSIAGAPSPALRRSVERTLLLLGPRVFTARGAVTHLRVAARVTRNDVHDGLHGDVFALSGSGGSFSGDVGTAFFALPAPGGAGRRVDVDLRLVP